MEWEERGDADSEEDEEICDGDGGVMPFAVFYGYFRRFILFLVCVAVLVVTECSVLPRQCTIQCMHCRGI